MSSTSTVPVPQAFALAVQHHQAGRLTEAEALYLQILAAQPDHAEALHYLGVIAHQMGHPDLAADRIRRAIDLNPRNPAAYSNLGAALAQQGRLDEAVTAYHRALDLKPNHAEAHNNLGNTLKDQGRFDEAVAAYRQAIQFNPEQATAHYNLGTALIEQGQFSEGIATFRRALELKSDYFEAHHSLGNALREQGQIDEAIAAFHRALQLRPDSPEAHSNLGNALRDRGQFHEAANAYRRALEFRPGFAAAHYNLGNVLRDFGQLDEAIAAYRRALELQEDYPGAWNNLGSALKDRGELDEAIADYKRAIQIKPDYRSALSNWICALQFRPASTAGEIAGALELWNRKFCAPLRPMRSLQTNDRHPTRRLRIGYVSPDFRSHPVSFFLAPLLEAHDRELFEIYCYADVRKPDAMSARLQKSADVWRDAHAFSDAQLAECVRKDGIDLLVDLAMHTAHNRLAAFARRPAPVQVSWLAYPGSTGVEAVDYRLTDARIDPPDQEDGGPGGRPIRLPDSWCCYAPIEEFPIVGPLPALSKKSVTFGSLNQFAKIGERLLQNWATLLSVVPESRLLIICPAGQAQARTHAFFAARGTARERVELVEPLPWPDYIRLFERVDVALDSYPCNGMTTTCHALWMGVPVVTLAGTRAVSRAGFSLLQTVELPELVAWTEEEYIRIATAWAIDLPRLARLRATLRSRMKTSPLMDAARFARSVETAYRTMWRAWCAQ